MYLLVVTHIRLLLKGNKERLWYWNVPPRKQGLIKSQLVCVMTWLILPHPHPIIPGLDQPAQWSLVKPRIATHASPLSYVSHPVSFKRRLKLLPSGLEDANLETRCQGWEARDKHARMSCCTIGEAPNTMAEKQRVIRMCSLVTE